MKIGSKVETLNRLSKRQIPVRIESLRVGEAEKGKGSGLLRKEAELRWPSSVQGASWPVA